MHWTKDAMREVCTFQNQALTWALKPLSSGLTYKKVETFGIYRVYSVLILYVLLSQGFFRKGV